jgi:hypothetical protein
VLVDDITASGLFVGGVGVTKSHSRLYVSNDNPYSESQFKTLKYRLEFPERFGCYQDGDRFCAEFSVGTTTSYHHIGVATEKFDSASLLYSNFLFGSG